MAGSAARTWGRRTKRNKMRPLAQLVDFQPAFVAANHCTGFRMMARLQAAFGERFIPAFVGTEIVFETIESGGAMKTYTGSCHCGAGSFAFKAPEIDTGVALQLLPSPVAREP